MNATTDTFDLADALTASRIDWSRLEEEGYSIAAIYADAVAHGDDVLARRASAANLRRAVKAARAGRLDEWMARP